MSSLLHPIDYFRGHRKSSTKKQEDEFIRQQEIERLQKSLDDIKIKQARNVEIQREIAETFDRQQAICDEVDDIMRILYKDKQFDQHPQFSGYVEELQAFLLKKDDPVLIDRYYLHLCHLLNSHNEMERLRSKLIREQLEILSYFLKTLSDEI